MAKKHSPKFLIFAILLYLIGSSVFSSEIQYGRDWKFLSVKSETQEYDFQSIKSKDIDWISQENNILDFGHTSGDIWLKVEVFDIPLDESKIFLVFGELLMHYAAVEVGNNDNKFIKETGITIPFENRDTQYVYSAFKLPIHSQKLFYVKIQSSSIISFPVSLRSKVEVYKALIEFKIIQGVFSFIFLMVILYTLLVYMPNKDVIYLYYLGYVVFTFLNLFVIRGAFFEFINIESGIWHAKIALFLYTTATIFVLIFSIRLLRVKFYLGKWIYLFYMLIVCYAINYILMFSDLEHPLPRDYPFVLSVVSTPVLLITSWVIYRKGNKLALFYLLAWTPMMILVSAYSLYHLLGLPYNFWLYYGPVLIIPVEFFVFNIVIFKKIKFEINITDYFIINKQQLGTYKKTNLSNIPVDKTISSLQNLMQVQKIYKQNADLNLSQLAEMLQIKPHQLTELMNQAMGTSFSNFLSKHKVQEAKRLLSENPELRIIDVAYESGFKSKSTFNTAFKQIVGTSPSDYAKKIGTVSSF
ncbi:MAG: 7TM diverse intracellular signaling domain-containing protein [Leptospirales bacterium]